MKVVATFFVVLLLAGCASVTKVESGQRAIGERLTVTLQGAWNYIDAPGLGPAQVWTMEGMPVDQLLLYSGLKDGQAVHATGGGAQAKTFAFRASMQPDEIVALFEGMLTRDGSRFALTKLSPVPFAGKTGFRFDYTLIRKIDNVQLTGIGWGMVDKGELYAIIYTAPRIVFFERHRPGVEQIAMSARLKN